MQRERAAARLQNDDAHTMSSRTGPKVGDAPVGVRITADNTTVLQNFALVGPTIVSAGGGGLMNANADEIGSLLGHQVRAYRSIAAN